MKIKYNPNKDAITIKNMSTEVYELIVKLMAHVRLGQSTAESEAAFEFLMAQDEFVMTEDEYDFVESDSVLTAVIMNGTEDAAFMCHPELVFD